MPGTGKQAPSSILVGILHSWNRNSSFSIRTLFGNEMVIVCGKVQKRWEIQPLLSPNVEFSEDKLWKGYAGSLLVQPST